MLLRHARLRERLLRALRVLPASLRQRAQSLAGAESPHKSYTEAELLARAEQFNEAAEGTEA